MFNEYPRTYSTPWEKKKNKKIKINMINEIERNKNINKMF